MKTVQVLNTEEVYKIARITSYGWRYEPDLDLWAHREYECLQTLEDAYNILSKIKGITDVCDE